MTTPKTERPAGNGATCRKYKNDDDNATLPPTIALWQMFAVGWTMGRASGKAEAELAARWWPTGWAEREHQRWATLPAPLSAEEIRTRTVASWAALETRCSDCGGPVSLPRVKAGATVCRDCSRVPAGVGR